MATGITTTSATVPKLTTIFTPPSGCWGRLFTFDKDDTTSNRNTVSWDPYRQEDVSTISSTLSCYPKEIVSEEAWYGVHWASPGVCPEGHQTLGTRVVGDETAAYCCLPGFSLTGGYWAWWDETPTCSSTVASSIEASCSSVEYNSGTDGILTGTTHWSRTSVFADVAMMYPIVAIWRSDDLPKFTPASAPVLHITESSPPSLNLSTLYTPPSTTTPFVSTASYETGSPGTNGLSDAYYVPWSKTTASAPTKRPSSSDATHARHRTQIGLNTALWTVIVTLLLIC